jgi:hypothetical protein
MKPTTFNPVIHVNSILQVCGGNAGALVRAAGCYKRLQGDQAGDWEAGKCGAVCDVYFK